MISRKPHEIIKENFDRKKSKNRAYSLRAMARDIQISPSHLSGIMNGKKTITKEILAILSDKLELDEVTRQKLSLAFLLTQTSISELKSVVSESLGNTKQVEFAFSNFKDSNLSHYDLLSKWYNVAILDLTTCDDFNPDTSWIANKLNISKYQVLTAVRELTEAGALSIQENIWKKNDLHLRFPTMNSKFLVRKFHEQMIDKASNALKTATSDDDFVRRLIGGTTIAANPEKIARAKEVLNQAMTRVTEILSEDGPITEIYQLNIQLFPLTQKSSKS